MEKTAQNSPVPRTAVREGIASTESVSVTQGLRAKIAQSSHAQTTAKTGVSVSMESVYVM